MTPEELRIRADTIYAYDPATGHFWWRQIPKRGKAKDGVPAGWICKLGYRLLKIDGKSHYAHRLAWLLIHGNLPRMLDHKNCVKDDNRICNLRTATDVGNAANRAKPTTNTSGLKGAYFVKGRWMAAIKYEKKFHWLGSFVSKEEAHAAYCKKAQQVFGEYWHA